MQPLTCLLYAPPPDKGTVQKVIALPSNNSLHEDLILEELEVFKVSPLLFIPSSLSSLSFLQNQREKGREGGGGLGQDTKGERAEAGGI